MLPPVEVDEVLVAQGIYQQVREGQPTHIQEFWSLHALPDQALSWRSQIVSGGSHLLSTCYLLRDPTMRPVQMIFFWRWQDGSHEVVEYRFMPGYVTILYGDRVQEMILPARYQLYGWHTITEHFLWLDYDRHVAGTQDFMLICPGIQQGTLWPGLMPLQASLEQKQIAPGQGGPQQHIIFAVDQPEIGQQRLHFDAFGVPVRWELPDERLEVVLMDYTRFE